MNAFKLILCVFGLYASGMMNIVSAASVPSTGVVSFVGAIVEDSCHVVRQGLKVQSSCYRNGRTITKRYNMTASATSPMLLPHNLGTTYVRWLDNSYKLGVLTVNYN